MNRIYEFEPSVCFYDGKFLRELQELDSTFERGLYETKSLANEFFVSHGNDVLKFDRIVTCRDCENVGYVDETERFILSDYYGLEKLTHFESAPDDFDWQSAGLRSTDDADYFYLGYWVAREKKKGKLIDCAEFSLTKKAHVELSAEGKKYIAALKISIPVEKTVKVVAFHMRDLVVPSDSGFLIRDVSSNARLLYGDERGIQCPHCRTYVSTTKGNWDGELYRIPLGRTNSFDRHVRMLFADFFKWFDRANGERKSVDSRKLEELRENLAEQIRQAALDAVAHENVFGGTCESCGEEMLFQKIEEVSVTPSEVIPYLDSATADLLMTGRFGERAVEKDRRFGRIQTRPDFGAFAEAFGFGSGKAEKRNTNQTKEKEEAEKLPKGWKFVKA